MERCDLRPIVDLLPRYAHQRRAGWSPTAVGHGNLSLSDYLLLRRVAIERDEPPVPEAALRANALDPYSTIDTFLDGLPRLVELGLLSQSTEGLALTSQGQGLLTRGEHAANDYAAARFHLAPVDLAPLATTLHDIADRQRQAPEPADKVHQRMVPRLRRFDARQTPAVLLEYALYALQRARDDAHIAAWCAIGIRGPSLGLLTHVWEREAISLDGLVELAGTRLHRQDVTRLLPELERDGYAEVMDSIVRITERGREVRNAIESETDRVYFAPWPEFDVARVREQLETLTSNLTH